MVSKKTKIPLQSSKGLRDGEIFVVLVSDSVLIPRPFGPPRVGGFIYWILPELVWNISEGSESLPLLPPDPDLVLKLPFPPRIQRYLKSGD